MAAKKNAKAKQEVILNNDENPLGFLDDFDGPSDDELWAETYNYVQWNNPERKWEFPLKHWAGSAIEQNYEISEVYHNNGQDTEHSVLIDVIHISVVAWRYTWEKFNEADGKMMYATRPVEGEAGWRKRYNFLALVKEAETDEACIITARSFTGEYIYNAIMQFRKKILKLASRMSGGKRLPGYLFWIPLTAGDRVMVGKEQKSAIFPPVAMVDDISELDDDGITYLLQSLYIGEDLKSLIAGQLFNEGQQWANEYREQAQLGGGDAKALPVSAEAIVLDGGLLYMPDLSAEKPPKWIDCAMSIPGLFNHREHASNALAKVLRQNRHKTGNDMAAQWEVFREDIERRYAEKVDLESSIEREKLLREGAI